MFLIGSKLYPFDSVILEIYRLLIEKVEGIRLASNDRGYRPYFTAQLSYDGNNDMRPCYAQNNDRHLEASIREGWLSPTAADLEWSLRSDRELDARVFIRIQVHVGELVGWWVPPNFLLGWAQGPVGSRGHG